MDGIEAQKLALRDQLVTARGRLGVAELNRRARELSDRLLDAPEIGRAATVAAYVSVGREPGTGPLLDALREAGKRVILPVLLPDRDLDWALYDGPESLGRAALGLLEPIGRRLGVDALAGADLTLVPGLAVDRTGMRLGRGGGSYDRALARVTGPTICLLNSEELLARVPAAAHDRRVDAAATEVGVTWFARGGPSAVS